MGIARKCIETSDGLGQGAVWSVERTISWLTGHHRRNIRYDRKATHFLGFHALAAALAGYKKPAKAKSAT